MYGGLACTLPLLILPAGAPGVAEHTLRAHVSLRPAASFSPLTLSLSLSRSSSRSFTLSNPFEISTCVHTGTFGDAETRWAEVEYWFLRGGSRIWDKMITHFTVLRVSSNLGIISLNARFYSFAYE